jgi:hypothetical protein
MKEFFGRIGLVALIGISLAVAPTRSSAWADTNTVVAPGATIDVSTNISYQDVGKQVFDFVKNGSNIVTAVYGIASKESGGGKLQYGGGVGVGYKITPWLVPFMRIEDLSGELSFMSASLQLQAPTRLSWTGISWLSNVVVNPFAGVGVETPISGLGGNTSTVAASVFAGADIHISKSLAIIGDYETVTGGGHQKRQQVRFGLAWAIKGW